MNLASLGCMTLLLLAVDLLCYSNAGKIKMNNAIRFGWNRWKPNAEFLYNAKLAVSNFDEKPQ